jgi:hypothetical protein
MLQASKGKEGELRQEGLQKLYEWVKNTPPEQRKVLLSDPAFRANILKMIDPHLNPFQRKGKEQQSAISEESLKALGPQTPEEALAIREKTAKVGEAESAAKLKETEANVAAYKEQFQTGKTKPSAMDLITNFEFKDPIAAALATSIPAEDLKNIALAQHKMGPIYEQTQLQDWYKWGMSQGFSPGLSFATATAISKGEWDKVPTQWMNPDTGKVQPVRGEAERKLALDTMNANTQMKSVQNTIESSIATATMQLVEKGVPPDQARANVMAMRQGKPLPFAMPQITDALALVTAAKNVEIQKNVQTILNDKNNAIRESLNTMLSTYKGISGTVMNSAQAKDLEDKINATVEGLTQNLSGKYGLKFQSYEELHTFMPTVKAAVAATWNGMKAAGAFPIDVDKQILDAIDKHIGVNEPPQPAPDFIPGGVIGSAKPGSALPSITKPKAEMTPDMEKVIRGIHESVQTALRDPAVTVDQRNKLQQYIDERVNPVIADPSRFQELLLSPTNALGAEQ